MLVRRFSPDLKTPVPGNHTNLYGVPIQLDQSFIPEERREEVAHRLNGLPILLDRPMVVVAMYLDPYSSMEEHSGDQPILFLVTQGKGFVRIGGPDGETRAVSAGDAVLWPVGLDHTVWTEEESLAAIVIDGPAERSR